MIQLVVLIVGLLIIPAYGKTGALEELVGKWVSLSEGTMLWITPEFSQFKIQIDSLGQGNLAPTNLNGANIKIQLQNLTCNYYVVFLENKNTAWALRSHDQRCPELGVLSRAQQ